MSEATCPECEATNAHEPWCSFYVHKEEDSNAVPETESEPYS